MYKIYFDNSKGIVLIDGEKAISPCLKEGNFSVQYFPYDCDRLPVQHAVCKMGVNLGDLLCIKHGNNAILKFSPTKKPVYDDCYIRKSVSVSQTSHLLTCRAQRTHEAVIETQNEIISLALPARADDATIKAKSLSSGQLIIVDIKIGKKTYLAILHYSDDYTLLMSAYCDKTEFNDDGTITLKDKLYDCMQRTCVRTVKFCGNGFIEESRYFEYDCDRIFPDELIPYVFLESVSCKDDDAVKNLVAPSLREWNFNALFGNFIAICDSVEYTPYKVTLIYGDNGFYTKTFCFSVADGKINFVNCL